MESEEPTTAKQDSILTLLRQEQSLIASVATTVLFLLFGGAWLANLSNPVWFAFILVWLFTVHFIISLCYRASRGKPRHHPRRTVWDDRLNAFGYRR
jgi:hypothetical protein